MAKHPKRPRNANHFATAHERPAIRAAMAYPARSWFFLAVLLALSGGCYHYDWFPEKFDPSTSAWEKVDPARYTDALHKCRRTYIDEHRLVGKVVEIDRQRGLVKLQTDEEVRVVRPSPQILAAIRPGETISAPEQGTPSQADQEKMVASCIAEQGYRLERHLVPGFIE